MSSKLEKDVLNFLILLMITIAGCKLTNGWLAWLMAGIGCLACMSGKLKVAITCFTFLPMLIFFAPPLVSGSQLGPAVRIGQIAILFSMLISPSVRNRKDYIPLGWLFAYSGVALISSMDGWMPLISYLKILNFALFVSGVQLLARMMQDSEESLYQLRVVLLGLSVFIIIGSVFAYFVPSVGYSMEISKAAQWGVYTTGEEVAAREGTKMFNGVLNHSQALANNVPLWFAWTLCDMLLIERRMSRMHMAIVIFAPILMYMSRSRTALVVFAVSMTMISFYCVPMSQIPLVAKRRIKGIVSLIGVAVVVAAIVGQVRNDMLSKWIRKCDDMSSDNKSLGEAFTSSRMGLVEYNLHDFKLNPILGKGFQVMDWHAAAYQSGQISVLSAPIEKGVLPLMVLGETGVVGAIVFVLFLISFYTTCVKKKYRVLLCLFTAVMASNMSEASFFSPGGATAQWTAAIIGGFDLDLIMKRSNERLRIGMPR